MGSFQHNSFLMLNLNSGWYQIGLHTLNSKRRFVYKLRYPEGLDKRITHSVFYQLLLTPSKNHLIHHVCRPNTEPWDKGAIDCTSPSSSLPAPLLNSPSEALMSYVHNLLS